MIAETGGGGVVIESGAQGATVETGGGSVEVRQCKGTVKVSTGGGSVELKDVGGSADIETGGGSIELNGVPSARAETGAGGIIAKFVGATGERTDSQLETSAGDIIVYLSPNLNITIRAAIELANGHNIRSEFPEIRVMTEGETYGPKTITAEGNLNGGGPVLKERTTTGDISIRRSR